MSQAALALATRDVLQQLLDMDSDSCEVGFPPGKPKPSCGETYVAVWPGAWKGISDDYDLREEFVINVTLTVRLGEPPLDRWGIAVWAAQNIGFQSLLRRIVTAVHQNQLLRLAANVCIGQEYGTVPDILYKPLWFLDGGTAEPKGADWFGASVPAIDDPMVIPQVECGVAQTLVFGKSERSQTIGGMV